MLNWSTKTVIRQRESQCYHSLLFTFDTRIAHALKVGELRPAPRPPASPLTTAASGGSVFRRQVAECWHVVFAPDETCFAWLCGTSQVLLVPWNRFKNCLYVLLKEFKIGLVFIHFWVHFEMISNLDPHWRLYCIMYKEQYIAYTVF